MSESLTLDQLNQIMADADLLKSKEEIDVALDQLAGAITERLSTSMPVVYSIMNGCLIFAGKLFPLLKFPLEVRYMHATSYRGETDGPAERQ